MNFSHGYFTYLLDADLNGQTITGSCFAKETPNTVVFPENMTGVTFINCNLDNVFIPPGNTLIDCSQRTYQAQNDLNDWEIDEQGNPVRILSEETYQKPPTPEMIPGEPVSEPVNYNLGAE